MGYAHYEITRNGEQIEAGYAVEANCEEPECKERIDRGLAYLCGQDPGGDEYGCGGYFCGKHMYGAPEGESGGRCERCLPATDDAFIRLDRRGLCPARVHFAPLDADGVVQHHYAAPPNDMSPCAGIGRQAKPVSADMELPVA